MKPLAGIPVPDRLAADEANLRSAFRRWRTFVDTTDRCGRNRKPVAATFFSSGHRPDGRSHRPRPHRHPGVDGGPAKQPDSRRQPGKGRQRGPRPRLGRNGSCGDRYCRRYSALSFAASRRELLDAGHEVFDGRMLLMRGADEPGPDEADYWLEGFDLLKQKPVFVPRELVSLDFTLGAAILPLLPVDRRPRLRQLPVGGGYSRIVRARRTRRDRVVAFPARYRRAGALRGSGGFCRWRH